MPMASPRSPGVIFKYSPMWKLCCNNHDKRFRVELGHNPSHIDFFISGRVRIDGELGVEPAPPQPSKPTILVKKYRPNW